VLVAFENRGLGAGANELLLSEMRIAEQDLLVTGIWEQEWQVFWGRRDRRMTLQHACEQRIMVAR
jgi:hypothetical protein